MRTASATCGVLYRTLNSDDEFYHFIPSPQHGDLTLTLSHSLPMPPFRYPSIRYLLGRGSLPSWQNQRRWARVHDVRFLATHGAQERIIDRYRDKLDRKAKTYVSSYRLPMAVVEAN